MFNNLINSGYLLKLRPYSNIHRNIQRLLTTSQILKSEKIKNEEILNDKPVDFFGSKAATWKAKSTRSGGADEVLWYQPYVISGSLAIFLLYFCYFREENDIDRKLEGNLFDHVEGLEEMQLTLNYKYNKDHGLDNAEIARKLKELGIDVTKI